MIIFGKNPVFELLRANKLKVDKVYLASDFKLSSYQRELLKGVKVQRVSRKKLKELSKTKKNQGIVAIVSPYDYLPEEEILRECLKKKGLILILDHITDPQNLGNIIRSGEQFGVCGILIPKDRACLVNETVIKASSGAVFHTKIAKVVNLSNFIRSFKRGGGLIFSLERGGKDIREVVFSFPMALVVGSEGEGVSKKLLDLSDEVVSIPTVGKVNSLNVSSATAIALWEIFRRS